MKLFLNVSKCSACRAQAEFIVHYMVDHVFVLEAICCKIHERPSKYVVSLVGQTLGAECCCHGYP